MKDILGVEVEVGDIIVSASGQGHHKIGKFYGFTRRGKLALIESEGRKWDSDLGEYTTQWSRVSSGYSVLVIGRESLGEMRVAPKMWDAIIRKYPGDES